MSTSPVTPSLRLHLKAVSLPAADGFRPGDIARVSVLARGLLVFEQLPVSE